VKLKQNRCELSERGRPKKSVGHRVAALLVNVPPGALHQTLDRSKVIHIVYANSLARRIDMNEKLFNDIKKSISMAAKEDVKLLKALEKK